MAKRSKIVIPWVIKIINSLAFRAPRTRRFPHMPWICSMVLVGFGLVNERLHADGTNGIEVITSPHAGLGGTATVRRGRSICFQRALRWRH